MKTRGRKNSFFVCFRPAIVDHDGDMPKPARKSKPASGERVLTYISVAGGDLIPAILSTEKQDASDTVDPHRRKRTLPRIIRSSASRTLPDGKLRNGNAKPDLVCYSIPPETGVSDDKKLPEIRRKPSEKRGRRNDGCSRVVYVYLMVMSMFLLVMWGRIWAIFFTSTWLCYLLVPDDSYQPENSKLSENLTNVPEGGRKMV